MTAAPSRARPTAGRHKGCIPSAMALNEIHPRQGADGALMKRATYASVSVACFLILLKFFAWLITASVILLVNN